jgi:hypothetical protein
MKKQLVLALILIFAVCSLLTAGNPRTYIQKCTLDTGLEGPVLNTGTTTNANYIVRATMTGPSTGPETLGTDLGTPATSIRISRLGTSPNFYTATTLQLGTFPTQWVSGWSVHMFVQYIPTGEIAQWDLVIPTGGTTINIQAPAQIIPPSTPVYNLYVNSVPAGYEIFKDTVDTGFLSNHMFTSSSPASLIGLYSMAAVPGHHWNFPTITVVPGDFVSGKATYSATITFTLIEDDVYVYNLHVNGPDGYAVGGPYPGNTDYIATAGTASALSGDYTIAAPPAGFTWVMNPITVIPEMFTAVKSGMGLSSGNAKATYTYQATIEFALQEIPVVIVPVPTNTVPPGYPEPSGYEAVSAYNVTGAGIHDVFIARQSGEEYAYALINGEWLAPNGTPDWTWLGVDLGAGKGTIPIVVLGAGKTFEVNSFDLTWYGANGYAFPTNTPAFNDPNDLGMQIWRNGVNLGVVTPYIFGAPGNLAYLAGTYEVVDPTAYYTNWLPSSVTFVNVSVSYAMDFLGEHQGIVPVELSSFTATLSAQNYVTLTWVSQTETGMTGYYIYRSTNNELEGAELISPMIDATNTSDQHSYEFTDNELYESGIYYYWLNSQDIDGTGNFHGPVSVYYSSTYDNPTPDIPIVTELKSIFPNPFNPTAYIPYSISKTADVSITVYNSRGQLIRDFSLGTKIPGNYNLVWNGQDRSGNGCGNGIYYFVMKAGKDSFQRKAVLMK